MTRHLLDVDDLAPAELAGVLDLALDENPPRVLAGRGVALLFQKPSARTRNSSEMAVFQLGGHPVTIRGDEVGIDTRESAEDVARTLAQYHAAIGARVLDHGVLERMVAVSSVPVVNLLSDRSHPLQAIADLLTLRAHWGGRLEGHRVAWVGDGNNVARSFALACAMTGVEVALATPPGHGLDDATLDAVVALGGTVSGGAVARRGGRGGRGGVHRRLGVHGPRGGVPGAAGGLRRLPGGRAADGPGGTGRRFSPLLAGSSGRRGHGRGHRRAGQPRLAPGGQPVAGHARAPELDVRWPAMRATKTQRQHRVSQILRKGTVTSQAELVRLLAEQGVDATQVTVSRDLEELGAVRVRGAGGALVYAIPEGPDDRPAPELHLRRVLGEWMADVTSSSNLVIVRTPPGCAHVVASALDRAGLADIAGTVAGDDTVLVIAAEGVKGSALARRLAAMAAPDPQQDLGPS